MKNVWRTLFGIVMLLAIGQVSAQASDAPAADDLVFPTDDFNRGTPRRSLEALMFQVETVPSR